MIKRALFFGYGVAAYATFLGTFLYAIGFVSGFGAPKVLDAPADGPFGRALLTDAALLTLFAVQHSVMARRWFKERWTRLVPCALERSTYVLFASLALIVLFWQWKPLGIAIWTVSDPVARLVLWTVAAFGWMQVLVTTFLINHFDLFGLRQVWLQLVGRPYTKVSLVTPMPYRVVRHPIYFGWVLITFGTPLMTGTRLSFAIISTAYLMVAVPFEERSLVGTLGDEYRKYQRRVRWRMIPGVY